MRIIKPGTAPADRLLQGECKQCGCQVECKRSETRDSEDQREPGRYVKCPTVRCSGIIWFGQ